MRPATGSRIDVDVVRRAGAGPIEFHTGLLMEFGNNLEDGPFMCGTETFTDRYENSVVRPMISAAPHCTVKS